VTKFLSDLCRLRNRSDRRARPDAKSVECAMSISDDGGDEDDGGEGDAGEGDAGEGDAGNKNNGQ
jgi:hypothetical protein